MLPTRRRPASKDLVFFVSISRRVTCCQRTMAHMVLICVTCIIAKDHIADGRLASLNRMCLGSLRVLMSRSERPLSWETKGGTKVCFRSCVLKKAAMVSARNSSSACIAFQTHVWLKRASASRVFIPFPISSAVLTFSWRSFQGRSRHTGTDLGARWKIQR